MTLNQKEQAAIKDLQTQEQNCIDKYTNYASSAKDPVLRELFNTLKKNEEEHYQSLGQVLNGQVPSCDCNDDQGKNYCPKATYSAGDNSDDKNHDCFLATDSIATEKLISGEYNSDVFVCGESDVRKLLADIQIEEQNHAEMIYKYKQANGMS